LLGLPPESITATLGLVTCAAIPNQIGITTITISLSKSDRFVEAATFNIIETSAEVGAPDCAKRFHYTAKADVDERAGSKHPTVKPLDLIQYLVRLVTPRGGVVLDPFAGSGTTGEAAWREGARSMLIEAEAEYLVDIRRRMALAMAGPDERERESLKARGLIETVEALPLFGGAIDE
jgi:DNA modification methylase